MRNKKLLFALAILPLTLVGCKEDEGTKPSTSDTPQVTVLEEYKNLEIMSINLDQGHQNSPTYHARIISKVSEVMPDLLGVQEESTGWASALEDEIETFGYKHIYRSRGGSYPEASGIFINMDRFEIKQSGTFWFGESANENTEGYVASSWGAIFPRICTWSLLHDKYVNKDISFFNAHYEYDHPRGVDGTPTDQNNTRECRLNSSKQVIDHMKALNVPGFFTGDLNFYREREPEHISTLTEYFDDAWAKYDGHQEICTWHDYGKELNPTTRTNPYSPIDYIFSTKDDFKVNSFTIMSNEGTQEEDFDSDHFFVHANFTYKNSGSSSQEDEPVTPPTPPTPPEPIEDNPKSIKVMSANLDQGHAGNSYYHNKVLNQFYTVMPDLLGVQEEGNNWISALQTPMEQKGYTHIVKTRGGAFPEASGIFIKNSRFDIKQSGTFWFCANEANEQVEGYVATEWGAAFPRVCTWALLHDKVLDKDISFFNAHLEYDHGKGNMNASATPEDNTIACRMNSVAQVIRHMKALGVPGFFTGDLNSFRSLEPSVYQTATSYLDDAWAKCGSQAMCTFHDYGKELNPATRSHPYEPIDYIYSTRGKFTANSFTIMSNAGTTESDFDSDHFFIHSTLTPKFA